MDIFDFLAPLVIGCISGLVAGWLALKSRFDRFQAMDEEREGNWREWRQTVDKRLDSHADRLQCLADHETRLKQTEGEVQKLRERWHDFRDGTLKEVYDLFRVWKDEMVEKFQPRK